MACHPEKTCYDEKQLKTRNDEQQRQQKAGYDAMQHDC